MTLTIQLSVYPDAYPTHGVWVAVMHFLIATGRRKVSVDQRIECRFTPV